MRRFHHWPVLLILPALALAPSLGCNSLKMAGLGLDPKPIGDARTDKPEKPDKDGPPTRPSKYQFRVSQYVFYSDKEARKDAPLFQELGELREQVTRELRLPHSSSLIHVYLFGDKERYDRFIRTRYPDLPERRAFFVAQPLSMGGEELLVFTYWSPKLRQDLRHELTHALLHSVHKDVPLWLDEGLAEYFELPPETKGLNTSHVHALRVTGSPPDMARLEQLSQVKQMRPAEYRESWAWVYLMLRGSPEAREVLLAYLKQLQTTPNPGPLHPRLAAALPAPEESLGRMLARLEAEHPPGETPRPPEDRAARR